MKTNKNLDCIFCSWYIMSLVLIILGMASIGDNGSSILLAVLFICGVITTTLSLLKLHDIFK